MQTLEGKRVVLAGSRRANEISAIIENLGGVPIVRSIQGSVEVENEKAEKEIRKLIEHGTDWVIATTSVGLELLYQAAERIKVAEDFIKVLANAKIAARGHKTVKFLKTRGLDPIVRSDDGTTEGILRGLEPFNLKDQRVALQLYGDHAPRLVQWLREQQVNLQEILPYRYTPPEQSVLDLLLADLLQAKVNAVLFTSALQVRVLMEYARKVDSTKRILAAFDDASVAVAIGKVCAEALREEGIARVVTPKEERMGSMVIALAEYFNSACF